MHHIKLIAVLITAIAITGCNLIPQTRAQAAGTSKYSGVTGLAMSQMISEDYVTLNGFHDPALQGKDDLEIMQDKNGNGVPERELILSDKGFLKVQVKGASLPANYSEQAKLNPSSLSSMYYEVTVNSSTAKNIKWEVWSAVDESMFSGPMMGNYDFKKAQGPFKAGQIAKIPNLMMSSTFAKNVPTQAKPVLVIYSPTERGEKVTVTVLPAKFGK